MTFLETIFGIVIYCSLYLYYNHGAILIAFSILILFFYVSYKDKSVIPYSVNYIIKKSSNHGPEKSIREHLLRYHRSAGRQRIMPTLIPLIITIAVSYILVNKILFFAIITSGSMSPTLAVKDLVLMQDLKMDIDNGDIIMFETKEANMPVIHRVYSVSGNGIRTKGDAAQLVDEWSLDKNQIKGKAILFQGKPIVIKNLGVYLLYNPDEIRVTNYGSEIYRISQMVKNFKKLGLLIFIICISIYIITNFSQTDNKRGT
jgi:signal peptidase I